MKDCMQLASRGLLSLYSLFHLSTGNSAAYIDSGLPDSVQSRNLTDMPWVFVSLILSSDSTLAITSLPLVNVTPKHPLKAIISYSLFPQAYVYLIDFIIY